MIDVFDYALEMERDGIEYYDRLAAEAPDDALKSIFTVLADEEKRHIEAIEAIRSQSSFIPASDALSKIRNVFEKLASDSFTLEDYDEPNDHYAQAYAHAREIEEKSAEFYTEQAKKATDESVRTMLLALAAQERQHEIVMHNLFIIVDRPNHWVEDAEFNHLEEY